MRADARTAPLLAVLAALVPATAPAAGFTVGEQGAAAFGLAGAGTARLDLPEAGFYDPAALARRPGLSLAAGGSAIAAVLSHEDPASGTVTDSEGGIETPPYFHGSWGQGSFGVGLSVDVPFGAGLAWPADWVGRHDVTEIRLQAIETALHLAWSPLPELSLAAGPRVLTSTVQLSRRVDAVTSEGQVTLGGEGTGLGAAVAVAYGPVGGLTLAATWRSRTTIDYEGVAHFEDVPIELSGKAHDGAVHTSVTLPDRIVLGGAYDFSGATASLDLEYTAWSTFETFAIDFADGATPDVVQPRDWRDTLAVRAGWEQRGLADGFALRGGLAYDPSPSPAETLSPTLPDQDRMLVTVGAGYELGAGLRVDGAVGHAFLLGAETAGEEAFPGRYTGSANVVTLGLAYRL